MREIDIVEALQDVTWNARSQRTFWEPEALAWAQRRLGRDCISAEDFARLRIGGDVLDGPVPGNRLVTVGLNNLTARLILGTPAWTASSGGAPGAGTGWTALGVGTSTTADAIGNTNLAGTMAWRVCDDAYPTQANGVLTLKTTYQSAEANHAWEEYGAAVPGVGASAISGVAAATSKPTNYILLNRKSPAALGTKSPGGAASLTLTITIS